MICATLEMLVAFTFILAQQCLAESSPSCYVYQLGQEYSQPQQYYNNYASSSYTYGTYVQPVAYESKEVVYYPYPIPVPYEDRPEKEWKNNEYRNPGDSCCSTVCAGVFYTSDNNKPKCSCRKSEDRNCHLSYEEDYYDKYCSCGCRGGRKNLKKLNLDSECRCNGNKRKFEDYSFCEFEDCRRDYSVPKCLCELDLGYNRREEPNWGCRNSKSKNRESKCGCSSSKCRGEDQDSIWDGLRAVDAFIKTIVSDVCDCC